MCGIHLGEGRKDRVLEDIYLKDTQYNKKKVEVNKKVRKSKKSKRQCFLLQKVINCEEQAKMK